MRAGMSARLSWQDSNEDIFIHSVVDRLCLFGWIYNYVSSLVPRTKMQLILCSSELKTVSNVLVCWEAHLRMGPSDFPILNASR